MKKIILLVLMFISADSFSYSTQHYSSFFIQNSKLKLTNYYKVKKLFDNSTHTNGYGSIGIGLGLVSNSFGASFSLDRIQDKIGFSMDLLVNFVPPQNQYYNNISFNQAKNIYNDKQLENVIGSLVLNIGPNFKLGNNFSAITGLSIAYNTTYTKFYDNSEILGENGNYFVENTTDTKFGFYGGVYYRINNKAGLKIAASNTNTIYLTYNLILF